ESGDERVQSLTVLCETSGYRQRRTRTRAGLETETVAIRRSHFLCAGKCRYGCNRRQRRDSRDRLAAAVCLRKTEQCRSNRRWAGRSAGNGDSGSFHDRKGADLWSDEIGGTLG